MMKTMNLDKLKLTVQKNCNIADARHAQSYSMCIYLMKMREYFRWEQGYLFTENLPKAALGDWITQREQAWEGLEAEPYQPLNIDGQSIDPFETEAINALLIPNGQLYSAGYGRYGQAHFFLGHLANVVEQPGFVVYYSGQEYARDLTSPPAMVRGNQVFIREESYKRMIWEKIQEWGWLKHKEKTAMGEALCAYQYDTDPMQALNNLAKDELDTVLWHEMGEWHTRQTLGDGWLDMVQQLVAQQENIARAVKDLLVDCRHTLPKLLEKGHAASIHFYFAQLQSTRKTLFPMLIEAYVDWQTSGSTQALHVCVDKGATHWFDVATQMMAQVNTGQLETNPDFLIRQMAL